MWRGAATENRDSLEKVVWQVKLGYEIQTKGYG